MTREPILSLLARKPFLPFRLTMTDRSVHEVRDPEYVELQESVLVFNRPDSSAANGKAWCRTLSLAHVTSLEVPMCDAPAIVAREGKAP